MRKQLIILSCLLFIAFFIFFLGFRITTYSNEISAIESETYKPITVLNEKKLNNGKIILYTTEDISLNGFSLNSAFVKETFNRWKCELISGHGGSTTMSSGYFTYDNNRVITGYVADKDIFKIEINIDDTTISPKMKIINDVRVWSIYLNEYEIDKNENNIIVIAKGKNDEEIERIDLKAYINSNN